MSLVYKVYHKIETDTYLVFVVLSLILSFTIANDLAIIVHPIVYYDVNHTTVPFLSNCDTGSLPDIREPLRWYTVCLSDHVFGASQLLPSLFSLALIPLVFYYSKTLTHSNSASILATLFTSLSTTYVNYAFSDTYPQFWVAFLIGTLYLVQSKRFSYLAVIPFVIGTLYQGLVLLDFPIILAQIRFGNKKKLLYASFIIPSVLLLGYTLTGGTAISNNAQFQNNISFDTILSSLSAFRVDPALYLSLPLLIPLLFKKRQNMILFSISYLIMQIFALSLFTNLYQQPYRLLPILVFMSIGFSDLYIQELLRFNRRVLV